MELCCLEVDLSRHELQHHFRAEHGGVGLLGHVLVERLPLGGRARQLGGRDGIELVELALDMRVVDIAEVLVVLRLDRPGVGYLS